MTTNEQKKTLSRFVKRNYFCFSQQSYPAPAAAQMPTQYMQPGYPYPYAYTNPQQGGAGK